MKLADLCDGIARLVNPDTGDIEIVHITYDSRKAQYGSIFTAIEGTNRDGHDYISTACQLGAVCVLTSKPEKVPCYMPIIQAENPRQAMARLARRLYDYPDRALKVVGITGTNGKTSFTFLVSHVLRPLGLAGRIGTLSYFNGISEEPASRTTPESTELFRNLGEMVANGCAYAALEVSSHGLILQRVLELEIRYAVFSNLSQDHLDFHGDMESYFQAKCRQFDLLAEGGVAIVNWDDPYGRRIEIPEQASLLRYGQSPEAELRFEVVDLNIKGSLFDVIYGDQRVRFHLPLIGKHNIYNFVPAIGVGMLEGRTLTEMADDTVGITPIPGRTELLTSGRDFGVIIDFAHTPDALDKVLAACAEVKPNRLIVVFGAGGDRDHSKREQMGKIVDTYADVILLTSDNPRTEDPAAIMDMVQAGIKHPLGECFFRNWDRKEAIELALEMADKGDLVVIAGKGHETTQEIMGVHHPFNDRMVAVNWLRARDEGD